LFQSRIKSHVIGGFKRVDVSGKRRIYDVSISNLVSRQNTVTGYLCVLRDVTELEQFDLAMSGANDGIWDWHLDTNTVHFDDRYYTMAGYEPQEFPGSSEAWVSRIHPDDIERCEHAIEQYIAAQIPRYDIEYRFRRKDDTWMWIRSRGKVVERNAKGEPVRFIGTHSDITTRKQAEEALQRFNEELEVRVRQRTAELEAANRELEEFAYIVSHDLKAPLHGINRLARWLQEDYAAVLDAQGQEQLDLLSNRVKRMDALIDGILRYSRSTHSPESEKAIDLNTLVPQVIDSLAPPAHITIRLEDTLPIIRGDPVQLTQVFQNLLSNAVKFMDKLAGKITIGCVDNGDTWTFRVEDNGPDIETRHHERIFRIFQSATPKDDLKSTGIGLTVVKKIVELYGGHIEVESEVGQGTVFTFSLPKQR
jgi:two-component system, LuxR family, sensor kinase FixL